MSDPSRGGGASSPPLPVLSALSPFVVASVLVPAVPTLMLAMVSAAAAIASVLFPDPSISIFESDIVARSLEHVVLGGSRSRRAGVVMWKRSTLAILVGCAVDPDGGAAPNDPAPTPTAAEEQALSVAAETAGSEASCYRWSEVAAGEDVTVTWTAPVAYNSNGERCGLGGADLQVTSVHILAAPAEHRALIEGCGAWDRVFDPTQFHHTDPYTSVGHIDPGDSQYRVPAALILPEAVTVVSAASWGCNSVTIFLFPEEGSAISEVSL